MLKRILWLSPRNPWPPQDGASVATVSLLRELTSAGYHIDLVCFVNRLGLLSNGEAIKQELRLDSVTLIRRGSSFRGGLRRSLKHFFLRPTIPLTIRDFCDNELKRRVNEALTTQDTPIVLDGLHVAALINEELLAHSIYRAHNVESAIWYSGAREAANIFRKKLLIWQAKLVQRFEENVVKKCHSVASVSENDTTQLQQICPSRVVTVPIGYTFSDYPRLIPSERFEVLFIGKLDWEPNRQGISWFLREVWSRAHKIRPALKLSIIGNGSFSYSPLPPGVEFLGRVDDLTPYYARSALVLVPIFFGSGTRVKAIEASRFARPLLSTRLGVEGLGLRDSKDFFAAEAHDEWVEHLSTVTYEQCERVGKAAYEALKKDFDAKVCASKFAALLDSLA